MYRGGSHHAPGSVATVMYRKSHIIAIAPPVNMLLGVNGARLLFELCNVVCALLINHRCCNEVCSAIVVRAGGQFGPFNNSVVIE